MKRTVVLLLLAAIMILFAACSSESEYKVYAEVPAAYYSDLYSNTTVENNTYTSLEYDIDTFDSEQAVTKKDLQIGDVTYELQYLRSEVRKLTTTRTDVYAVTNGFPYDKDAAENNMGLLSQPCIRFFEGTDRVQHINFRFAKLDLDEGLCPEEIGEITKEYLECNLGIDFSKYNDVIIHTSPVANSFEWCRKVNGFVLADGVRVSVKHDGTMGGLFLPQEYTMNIDKIPEALYEKGGETEDEVLTGKIRSTLKEFSKDITDYSIAGLDQVVYLYNRNGMLTLFYTVYANHEDGQEVMHILVVIPE